jgi:hypothetical protein
MASARAQARASTASARLTCAVDQLLANAVVDDAEEADVRGCLHHLLAHGRIVGVHVHGWHRARPRGAVPATHETPLHLDLVERLGHLVRSKKRRRFA